MTLATDFTRDDCQVGSRRLRYDRLQREYVCGICGGGLTKRWDDSQPESWHITCTHCGSHDFIHECELQRQEKDAREVLDGLPPELAALFESERKSSGMAPEELNALMYPAPIEI